MENIYDKALNCKLSGQIEKIKTDLGPQNCEISYIITMKYNNELYLLQGIGKNTTNPDPSCTYEREYYSFSGASPKIGDNLYVIAGILSNDIKETGKNIYDTNKDLNICGQYPVNFLGTGYIQERYEIMNICKVSGKINNIVRTPDKEEIVSSINMKIISSHNEFFNLSANELILDKDGTSKVLGLNTNYPTYDQNGKIYFPKKGDDFYGIVKTENNQLLKVGIDNYNQYINIPDCTGETISSNSGELLINTGTDILLNTSEIQTGKVLEKNISSIKKEVIIPKKIVNTSSNKNVQTPKNDIANSEILTGEIAKNTESNSGITDLTGVSNKPYKTETGVIIKQENDYLALPSTGINGFYILVIALILTTTFILVFRKK